MTVRQFLMRRVLRRGFRAAAPHESKRGRSVKPTAERLEDRTVPSTVYGDFNGDGYDDAAIGVPGEDVNGAADAGAVNVIYGSPNALNTFHNQLWTQNNLGAVDPRTGLVDTSEAGDKFGASLAA